MRSERDLHALALFVHGALAFGHVLGILYGVIRRRWFELGVHSAAVVFGVWAVNNHAKSIRPRSSEKSDSMISA